MLFISCTAMVAAVALCESEAARIPTLAPSILNQNAPTNSSCHKASNESIAWCLEQYRGICVTSEFECDSLKGKFDESVGCSNLEASGCSCCRDADPSLTSAPSSMPVLQLNAAAPVTSSLAPTILPPNFNPNSLEGSTCDAATFEAVFQCFQIHRGVCVKSHQECISFQGMYDAEAGCNAPDGSGCSCCKNTSVTPGPSLVQPFLLPSSVQGRPTTSPSIRKVQVREIHEKKKSSRQPLFFVVLITVLACSNFCCLLLLFFRCTERFALVDNDHTGETADPIILATSNTNAEKVQSSSL